MSLLSRLGLIRPKVQPIKKSKEHCRLYAQLAEAADAEEWAERRLAGIRSRIKKYHYHPTMLASEAIAIFAVAAAHKHSLQCLDQLLAIEKGKANEAN